MQITINKLKQAFELREKEFKEDRESLVVFFNTVNNIIKKASEEIKAVYFKQYANILTDKHIVETLNGLSEKISQNNSKLSNIFADNNISEEEKQNLQVKISDATNGKKVKIKDLETLITLNNKIIRLNQQTKIDMSPPQ